MSRMTKTMLLAVAITIITLPLRDQIVWVNHLFAGVGIACIAYLVVLWFDLEDPNE